MKNSQEQNGSNSSIRRRKFAQLKLCIDCGDKPIEDSKFKYCEKCYKRIINYRLKRKEIRSNRIDLGLCRDCGTADVTKGKKVKLCQKCYDERVDRSKRYKQKNGISVQGKYNKNLRLQALKIVAKINHPVCNKCGCDIIGLLEINHMNHNGKIDYKPNGKLESWKFYRNIVNGIRQTNDLNVLCKICNIAYFVSKNFGKNGQWDIKFSPIC